MPLCCWVPDLGMAKNLIFAQSPLGRTIKFKSYNSTFSGYKPTFDTEAKYTLSAGVWLTGPTLHSPD